MCGPEWGEKGVSIYVLCGLNKWCCTIIVTAAIDMGAQNACHKSSTGLVVLDWCAFVL